MESFMEKKQIDSTTIDFYSLFTIFLICSFFGWIYETLLVLLNTGTYRSMGLLFIKISVKNSFPFIFVYQSEDILPFIWGFPIIIIYGFGGIIIALIFRKIKINSFVVYFGGMIVITFFELCSSFFCEFFLHRNYWDYSNKMCNYQGRICLSASVVWGFVAVFTVKFLIPKASYLYLLEKRIRHSKAMVNVFIFYLLICIYKRYI